MLFFNRSLLSQFSAITDKTAAQRFLDEHWHLYEDGRRYQRDSEAALNRGVGKFERMGAVHLPHNDEQWDGSRLTGNHHGRNNESKEEIATGKPVLGEGKARQGAEEQGCNGSNDGGEHAVVQVPPHGNQREQVDEVVQGEMLDMKGVETGNRLSNRFDRNNAHPHHGEQAKDDDDGEEQIHQKQSTFFATGKQGHGSTSLILHRFCGGL